MQPDPSIELAWHGKPVNSAHIKRCVAQVDEHQ